MSQQTQLIFDLETVPDLDLYTPPEQEAGAEPPMAPIYAHRPVAIGVLWLDPAYGFRRLGIVGEERPEQDEAAILTDFLEFIEHHRPRLVTYNGRSFDLPVVVMRALRHGLSLPWYYRGRDFRYRYSDAGHLDLCDTLADHGATRFISLDAAARLIGLPGKMEVEGNQVEGLYKAGKLDVIRRYCLTDVVQTAFLLLRFQLLQGALDRQRYRRVAAELLEALQADGRVEELIERVDRGRLLLEGDGGDPDTST